MADIEKLRVEAKEAEAAAHKLQAEKDEAVQKVIDKYRDKQREANNRAAATQKLVCDTEAHLALEGHPDRDAITATMRTQAEQHLTGAAAMRNTRPDGTLDVKAYEAEIQQHRDRAQSLGFDHLPFYQA